MCHVIQSDILNVYHSLTNFFLFAFLFQLCMSSRGGISCDSLVPLQFSLFDLVIATDAMPPNGTFIFRLKGFLSPVLAPGLVLCARCILSCKPLGYGTHAA